ncbi:MAG: YdcF family protein [Myxococcales bacterium]|nr:YdcF family protein [Myxococcales bacterium]MCB9733505.1 YdcF family protein [Deltaproteobacteria bacterium]
MADASADTLITTPDAASATDATADTVTDTAPDTVPAPDTVTVTDTVTAPDTAADTDTDTDTDATDTLTAADTTTAADTFTPAAAASCPVADLIARYPGDFPPDPFGAWPAATACVASRHDVAIVLGCPSNEDGSPSACQTARATIAKRLYNAGLADRFIVSGAAVHNAHVEADALAALLVAFGVPDDAVVREPLAEHTDENLYYSTLLMAERGWRSAWVVSDDPGHLLYSALCDANCCVRLGRLTLFGLPLPGTDGDGVQKIGHYALTPPGVAVSDAECADLQSGLKAFVCTNLPTRRACAGRITLPAR